MSLRAFRSKLAREITVVVIVKLLLLTLIWLFFFRDRHVAVDDKAMANALRLGTPQTLKHQGDQHDDQ